MSKSHTTYSAEKLFSLLQNNSDPAAFEELYNRYWLRLYMTAYKRLSCKEDAEEAVQNLFESLWKNRHKIHIRTSLENYLFAAIRYIVLHTIYKKTATQSLPSQEEEVSYPADNSCEENILVNDLTSQIDKIINGLPPKCRQVFELSRYEMKTHKDIARLMGISEKTVENHITKALHQIRTSLNHFFFL
ncbi:MAG: RNA polymerase sigma-70 factor [Chitinophagaceae bacterium]|nr:MAG: RNA polymerase sigma-70 factor [Chitinophagaceae bacterium]